MKRYCLTLLSIFTCSFLPIYAGGSTTNPIVVIGDSLSDSGNLPETTVEKIFGLGTVIGSTGAPKTDGTTWAVWLNDLLYDKWLLPSSQNGTNFAVAGALTVGTVPIPPLPPNYPVQLIPSLTLQTASIGPQIDHNSPVFIWGGANDFIELGDRGIDPNQPTLSSQNISAIVQSIHDQGFKTIVVFNLPNLKDIPSLSAPGNFHTNNPDINLVEAYGIEFNVLLAEALAGKNYPVLGIDAFALITDVVANPAEYGFTNVTDATPSTQYDYTDIISPPTVGSPTDGYLFFYDGTHPTHKAHRTLAEFVYTTIVAPSFFGGLSQKTFSISREIMANIHLQSFAVQPCHECGVLYPFINGSYAPLLRNAKNSHVSNVDNEGGDLTLGVTYDFNHNYRIGIAGSALWHYFKNKKHLTHYTTDVFTGAGTVFGGYQDSNGYLEAALTTSWHEFDKIKRSFATGLATHETKGKTDGLDFHGEITGAYLFIKPTDNLSTGPIIDFNYQWVNINGYAEDGARIGNLQFKDYHNDIFTTGLGWELNYCFDYCLFDESISFIADGYIMANRQWLSHTKGIEFRQISFGDNFGAWPVVLASRNNYFTTSLSLSANTCCGAIFTCGYNMNVGNFSMSEHVVTFGITMPMGY